MTVFRYEIPIEITLQVPFATRGLTVSRASLDLPLARNSNKELIIPGTLVMGNVRAALERLAAVPGAPPIANEIASLLGRPSEPDTAASQTAWKVANEPWRAQLTIRDLVIDAASAAKRLEDPSDYPRIRVDAVLGSVAEGYLQFIEQPFALGDTVTFTGTVDLRVGPVTAARAEALLKKALALVPALGAIKASGFGRVASVVVGAAAPIRATSGAGSTAPGDLRSVVYTLDRPFLVGGAMASTNLFRGAAVVPGGAIKGALARALDDAGLKSAAMDDLLARLTIGHAFPRPEGSQDPPWLPLPLSLAQTDDHGNVVDCLFADATAVSESLASSLRFAPDFKSDARLHRHLGRSGKPPSHDVRTRTKIDNRTGAAAYEDGAGQLFSYAAIKPSGFEWIGRWVVPATADPVLLQTIESFLAAGVAELGKTDAVLRAQVSAVQTLPQPGNELALTLLTPAPLNDLDALRGGRSLRDDYAAYWQDLGYELVTFFAQQRLEGGYIALRYPPKPGASEPYLLTEPGSVFLVRCQSNPKVLPAELLRTGLPPTSWIADCHWRSCPFLPENGFGEVCLDRVDHRAFASRQAFTMEAAG